MSSTIIELNAPQTQAFDFQPSSELQIIPTPTLNTLVQQLAGFDSLTSALEYAAKGVTGYNFYDARGNLRSVLPYSVLRENARDLARRFMNFDLPRDRKSVV